MEKRDITIIGDFHTPQSRKWVCWRPEIYDTTFHIPVQRYTQDKLDRLEHQREMIKESSKELLIPLLKLLQENPPTCMSERCTGSLGFTAKVPCLQRKES